MTVTQCDRTTTVILPTTRGTVTNEESKIPNLLQKEFLQAMCMAAATAAKSLQLCPTPCDPTDGSPPGSPVSGTLQARTLEWVAISFSNA